ncbi:FAD/NAD(P)-binding domain-containing protein [Mollisia scopiformis]|uniref:FAD/NAD(P)-binding domain-containing protein n=1 Tax=Mollisia scopiformis TaxID=149040 RepID=A0A194XAG3_MOLSC|nr:FAD/NAD(P)-binding domain-containing protein [Mollisia scopiformis]KUJ17156.1 FAD/NAD(P)-binding domain-containing protein [Mollisia scopiformis]
MGDISGEDLPPKRVAVIGAGISGITAAKHLKHVGINAVVFERSSRIGGNWLYDARRPVEPTYPSLKASIADPWIAKTGDEECTSEDDLKFAPPGPAYPDLTNNVSTKCQSLKEFPWPKRTPDHVSVHVKQKYIQDYAEKFGVVPLIRFNTRVEKLEKVGQTWKVRSTTLIKDQDGRGRRKESVEEFDNVVVASGHYHASKIPDIPGLKEWKAAWPDRVEHSKRYRGPQDYRDQTVLLIGGGVSSADIGRECSGVAKKIYQSSRGGTFDLPESFISPETERITGINSFSPPSSDSKNAPGTVTLIDGRILSDIDRVIVCTGYLFSLPFLPELHNDDLSAEEANETVLVTDGLQLHNLHKDIFYIPDPTLSFIGVPAYTATFTFFEFQAIAVSAVISSHAFLPSEEEMRKEYEERVKAKGYGRAFHSLIRGQDELYVEELVGWLNRDAEKTGGEKFEPYDDAWKEEKKQFFEKYRALLESSGKVEKASGFGVETELEKAFRGVNIGKIEVEN